MCIYLINCIVQVVRKAANCQSKTCLCSPPHNLAKHGPIFEFFQREIGSEFLTSPSPPRTSSNFNRVTTLPCEEIPGSFLTHGGQQPVFCHHLVYSLQFMCHVNVLQIVNDFRKTRDDFSLYVRRRHRQRFKHLLH